MNRVANKVALVTGAASGVGRADALLLAAEGARVVLTDIDEDAGRALAREIGDAALFVRHDIADEAGWQHAIASTLDRFGRLDVLVNNAAICPVGSIEDTSLDTWRRVMRTNADGYFLGCQYAIGAMKGNDTPADRDDVVGRRARRAADDVRVHRVERRGDGARAQRRRALQAATTGSAATRSIRTASGRR